ncbi:MAG: aminotransferase class V-fold PLP-dependent enzyme [Phycisphaerae bacterium]
MTTSRRNFIQQGLTFGALAYSLLREDALELVEAANAQVEGRTPEGVAADESYWFQIQQAFAIDRSMINLNNGGVSPAPRVVQDAVRRHVDYANQAPSRYMWKNLDPQVETSRARLAALFGCDPEEMAIVRNSSEALEICIYGVDLKAGDEVLTSAQDYPRMINTFKQREQREGIVLKTFDLPMPCDDPAEIVAAFERNITPRTRMVLCCHVINITGQIIPVRQIVALGRKHDIPVIVDGAHAFAHLVFNRDELDCDYYGTSLHKWLTAPLGTGFLYVRKRCIPKLWPLMAAPEPQGDNIRKYEEIGTHPAALKLAVSEAAAFHTGIGPERKQARMRYLCRRWADRLTQDPRVRLYAKLDPAHCCGVATFQIDGVDPVKLCDHLLSKHRIFTVAIDGPGVKGIRVTPNVYTMIDEVDAFATAVEDVLRRGLPA